MLNTAWGLMFSIAISFLSPPTTGPAKPIASFPSTQPTQRQKNPSNPSTHPLKKQTIPKAWLSFPRRPKSPPSSDGSKPHENRILKISLSQNKSSYFFAGGNYQFSYYYFSDIPTDNLGNALKPEPNKTLFNRLTLEMGFESPNLKFFFQQRLFLYDLFYGTEKIPGREFYSPIRSQASGFSWAEFPRQFWLSWRSPIGLLKLGQMTSSWGLGVLANDGERPAGEFSIPRFGDLVERILLAVPILRAFSEREWTKRFFIAGAFDLVFRDDYAELLKGDIALQGVISAFYRSETLFAGIYIALRDQKDRTGEVLKAQAYDLFLRWRRNFFRGKLGLYAEGEWIFLRGWTDRILTEGGKDGVELSSFGGVVRGGFRLPEGGLRLGIEVGFASGDENPYDGAVTQFSFDPDYQPSLLLFSKVLSAVSAQSAVRAADRERIGVPQRGIGQLFTYGKVSNVLYVQPVVSYRPFAPFIRTLRSLELKIGILFAQSTAGIIDPYLSYRAGGVPITPFSKELSGERDLGTELNISLSYSYNIWKVRLKLALLYGIFFPGTLLTPSDGASQNIDTFQIYLKGSF